MALLAAGTAVKANNTNDGTLTENHAINTYVDAMTRGKLQGLNDVLDQSAQFSMLRGKTIVLSFSKKQMLDYMQANKNTEQTCTTSTSIVEEVNANIVVVKVDMKYEGFCAQQLRNYCQHR